MYWNRRILIVVLISARCTDLLQYWIFSKQISTCFHNCFCQRANDILGECFFRQKIKWYAEGRQIIVWDGGEPCNVPFGRS